MGWPFILALSARAQPAEHFTRGDKKMLKRIVTMAASAAPSMLIPAKNAASRRGFRALLGSLIVGSGLLAIPALASTTITGVVGTTGKYLVTGAPVSVTMATMLKISFANNTAGTNLELCAGSAADFASGTCSTRLSDSGGPGFVFLTITDTSQLAGKIIFVQRAVGVAASEFVLTIE